ncbi:hypothetical protein [Streptomyces lushanensis]|uniref:hypothetical protein n=1 Tax=Streptomyces lushanensis TaxID=1434255 RepID=UPI0008308D8F|nr:hypothetical protein [Streptomyces lushanensis]
MSRWRARVIEPDALPRIPSKESEGRGTETFGYFEPKRYYEDTRSLYYDFTDTPGTLIYSPADGREQTTRHTSAVDQKGVLRLPHHGYVTVSSNGRWTVSVT